MKGPSSSIVLVGILTAIAIGSTSGFFFHKDKSSPKFSAVSLFPPYGGSEERGGFGRGRGRGRGRGDRGRGRGRGRGGGRGDRDENVRRLGADTAAVPKGKLIPISTPTYNSNNNGKPNPLN